uniref:Transmembrane protein n=1 Tax=Medicago truncatula TaxID=3880 RepID=I3S702_MEDTR|nr:unknown [Medicago truncatula]
MRISIMEKPLLSFVVIHLKTSILWSVFLWKKVICQALMLNSSANSMLLLSVVAHVQPKN